MRLKRAKGNQNAGGEGPAWCGWFAVTIRVSVRRGVLGRGSFYKLLSWSQRKFGVSGACAVRSKNIPTFLGMLECPAVGS